MIIERRLTREEIRLYSLTFQQKQYGVFSSILGGARAVAGRASIGAQKVAGKVNRAVSGVGELSTQVTARNNDFAAKEANNIINSQKAANVGQNIDNAIVDKTKGWWNKTKDFFTGSNSTLRQGYKDVRTPQKRAEDIAKYGKQDQVVKNTPEGSVMKEKPQVEQQQPSSVMQEKPAVQQPGTPQPQTQSVQQQPPVNQTPQTQQPQSKQTTTSGTGISSRDIWIGAGALGTGIGTASILYNNKK